MLPFYWLRCYPAKAEFNTLTKNNRKSYSIYIKLFLILTYQYYIVIEMELLAV